MQLATSHYLAFQLAALGLECQPDILTALPAGKRMELKLTTVITGV